MQGIKPHSHPKRFRKEQKKKHSTYSISFHTRNYQQIKYRNSSSRKMSYMILYNSRSKTRVSSLCVFLYILMLEVPVRAAHQEEEIKGIHLGKKEVHFTLFPNDTSIHIKNTKNPTNEKRNKSLKV